MNYIIEGDINFFNELNNELKKSPIQETKSDDICLITHEALTDNYITLSCNHRFNYIPLYLEVLNQKNRYSSLETTHLKINEIKCPYCRTITTKLLPYINCGCVHRVYGVNSPLKFCMKLHSCQWAKRGDLNNICGKDAYKSDIGTYCSIHQNAVKNKIVKKIEDTSEWTKQHIEIHKKYNVSELKQILRDNKMRVGGIKSDLVNRIIHNKLI